MQTRRPLVAGNWKMNGLKSAVAEFGRIMDGYDRALKARVDLLICPPATLLTTLPVVALGSRIAIGAQDCHAKAHGAHTGDISAEMIADTGATAILVGHSERRADHYETDAIVRAKAEAVRRAGLLAIICVGETGAEREAGRALEVVCAQLAGSVPDNATGGDFVIAYEPVWAIGSGLTPTATDIVEVHATIRRVLVERFGDEGEKIRLLYGGSVKPENAREILSLSNVDGALVGGASLQATAFLEIARSYM